MSKGVTKNGNSENLFLLTFGSVAEALAFLATGGGGGAAIVYRPGGVEGGNVYTTWATAYAALNALTGFRVLSVDTSLGTATIDVAGANLAGVWIVGTRGATQLRIADGVTLAGLNGAVLWNLWLMGLGTAGAHYTTVATNEQVDLRGNSTLFQLGAGGALVQLGAGHTWNLQLNDTSATLGVGTGRAVNAPAATTWNVFVTGFDAAVLGSSLTGAGTAAPRLGGTFAGFVLQASAGHSGPVVWQQAGTKHWLFAGTVAGSAGFTPQYLAEGSNPLLAAAPAAPYGYQFADQRRFQRLVAKVLACTMVTDTVLEVYVDSVATGVTVTVPALTAGNTVLLGARVNGALSNGATSGSSAGVDIRAANTAGGIGNSLIVLVTMEYV